MIYALLMALIVAGGAGDDMQLLTDPTFARTAELLAQPPADLDILEQQRLWPWIVHEVELPAKAQFAPPSATLSGGILFLHSSAFDVEPGKTYQLTFQASGDGQVSAAFTWWQRNDDDGARRAQPHLAMMDQPVQPGDGKTVTFRAQPPAGATRAYIRIIVRQGRITLSDPRVAPVAD